MLWKLNGKLMKTPSTYKDNIEDTENDSYTSKVTGALIDNPIAIGMLNLEMSWEYLTEKEAEELLQATYQNPMIVTVKCPSSEMYLTGEDEDTSKSKWKVSFNLMQKELTEQQKQTVNKAKGVN